jgi:hypothetical protein
MSNETRKIWNEVWVWGVGQHTLGKKRRRRGDRKVMRNRRRKKGVGISVWMRGLAVHGTACRLSYIMLYEWRVNRCRK